MRLYGYSLFGIKTNMDVVGIICLGNQTRDFSSIVCKNIKHIEKISDLNDNFRKYNYISVDSITNIRDWNNIHHFDYIETVNNLTEDDKFYLSELRYEFKEKRCDFFVFMRTILRQEHRNFPIVLHIKERYGNQLFQYWIAKYLADKLKRPLVVTSQFPFLLSKNIFPNMGDIAMTINYQDPDNIIRCTMYDFDYIDHILKNAKDFEHRHIVIDSFSNSYELVKKYEFYIRNLYKPRKTMYTMDRILIHIRLGDIVSDNIKVPNFPEYCIKIIQQIHKSIGMLQVVLLSENSEHPYTKSVMDKICQSGIDINLISKESIEADFDKILESSHVILTNSAWTWWAAFLNPNKHVYIALSCKQGGRKRNTPLFIKDSPENFEIFDLDNFKMISCIKPRFAICVARYDEDVSWLKKHAKYADIFIYNKGAPLNCTEFNEIHVKNVGLDGYVHLKHIVDHYDNLHDITFFTQARIDNHGYDPDSIKEMFFDHEFVKQSGTSHNICRWPVSITDFCIDGPTNNRWTSGYTMKDFWTKYIETNIVEPPMLFKWYKNMIFSAKKENIKKRSKEYYLTLLNDDINVVRKPQNLHYLERSWYYILHPEWKNQDYTKQIGQFFAKYVKNNGFNLVSEEICMNFGFHNYYKSATPPKIQTCIDDKKDSKKIL